MCLFLPRRIGGTLNLGYLNRRVSSINYRLRIVSLASDSMNLYHKPNKGYDCYRIGSRTYCSEVKIGNRISATSRSGSLFSVRMQRVPYATKPFQTAINLRFYYQHKQIGIGGRQRLSKSASKAKEWNRRLQNKLAYFQRFGIGYINSLPTRKRFHDFKRTYLKTKSS